MNSAYDGEAASPSSIMPVFLSIIALSRIELRMMPSICS